jgi:hypothetical protein
MEKMWRMMEFKWGQWNIGLKIEVDNDNNLVISGFVVFE